MKTFPGSSEQNALQPLSQADPVSVATRDKLAALATDDPLPLPRTQDRVRLLVQSPHRLFLYWTFRRNPFESLPRAFGARAAGFRFGVRLLNLTDGSDEFAPAGLDETGRAGEYWFTAQPGTGYAAHIGFLTDRNFFIRLLASQPVQTPRLSVSPRADDAPQFKAPPAEFARVLNETGYARDALAVRFEAADVRATEPLSQRIAAGFFDGQAFALEQQDAQTLRTLLLALALNEPLAGVNLPAALREELQRNLAAYDLAELRRRIIHALGFTAEEFDELEADGVTAQTWSSFSIGASRVRLPSSRRRDWLPSLNHELLASLRSPRATLP